jgi:hypothetical protein
MSGHYLIPREHVFPVEYIQLFKRCLQVDVDERISLASLRQLLSEYQSSSSPPHLHSQHQQQRRQSEQIIIIDNPNISSGGSSSSSSNSNSSSNVVIVVVVVVVVVVGGVAVAVAVVIVSVVEVPKATNSVKFKHKVIRLIARSRSMWWSRHHRCSEDVGVPCNSSLS